MLSGFLRGNNGPQTNGYLRSEKYPFRFDGFLLGNNGPQNDGYLRSRRWAFDDVVVETGGDVTGTAAGSITAVNGLAAGVHGFIGNAAGSTTATNGVATGLACVIGNAAGSTTPATGAAVGTHDTGVAAPPFSNTGYGGTLGARKRISVDENDQRRKALRRVRADLYPSEGTASGQLARVFGAAMFMAGTALTAKGLTKSVSGRANGVHEQFSDSEMAEILAMIEDIEAIENLELTDA